MEGLDGMQREADGKGGANAWGRVAGELAVVTIDNNLIADREAESGSFADLFGGVERIEDALAHMVGDAPPIIGDGDRDAIVVDLCGDLDLARGVRLAQALTVAELSFDRIDRIGDQVHEHLIEWANVAIDGGQFAILSHDRNARAIRRCP